MIKSIPPLHSRVLPMLHQTLRSQSSKRTIKRHVYRLRGWEDKKVIITHFVKHVICLIFFIFKQQLKSRQPPLVWLIMVQHLVCIYTFEIDVNIVY